MAERKAKPEMVDQVIAEWGWALAFPPRLWLCWKARKGRCALDVLHSQGRLDSARTGYPRWVSAIVQYLRCFRNQRA